MYFAQLIGPTLLQCSMKKGGSSRKMGNFPSPMGYLRNPVWLNLGACS
jgi:hypothetical protein